MPAQTLSEIRARLAAAGLSPLHRFGQNFLIDLNLLRRVAAAGEPGPADVILEVGPGTGSLTSLLLDAGARVVAIEIDRGLQAMLRDEFSAQPRFQLIAGDALSTKHKLNADLLAALRTQRPAAGGTTKLIANLPYQIATPLLIELLLLDDPWFSRLVCTIQLEVGQRLAASAGSDAYGPISVIAQTLGRVRLLGTLPPAAFWPRPGVDSALVEIVPLAVEQRPVAQVAAFARWVQRAFQQRRKTLRRILSKWEEFDADAVLAAAGISSAARPEALAPAEWLALYRQATERAADR